MIIIFFFNVFTKSREKKSTFTLNAGISRVQCHLWAPVFGTVHFSFIIRAKHQIQGEKKRKKKRKKAVPEVLIF